MSPGPRRTFVPRGIVIAEFAGLENDRLEKLRTTSKGWKLQDWKMTDWKMADWNLAEYNGDDVGNEK